MVSAAPPGTLTTRRVSTTSLSSTRPLGITWLAVSAPVATVGAVQVGICEQTLLRSAGFLLLGLAAAGVAVDARVLSGAHLRAREVPYAASLLWLVGTAVVYPTQDFAGRRAVGGRAAAARRGPDRPGRLACRPPGSVGPLGPVSPSRPR